MHCEKSFTIRCPKPHKNSIIVDVILSFYVYFAEVPRQIEIKVKALIDTGANGSCISRRLVEACRLEKKSAITVFSIQGESEVPVYEVDFTLPNGMKFENIPVMEIPGSKKFDVIIGMNILAQCDVALTNDENGLVFSMRCPSRNQAIDFCEE